MTTTSKRPCKAVGQALVVAMASPHPCNAGDIRCVAWAIRAKAAPFSACCEVYAITLAHNLGSSGAGQQQQQQDEAGTPQQLHISVASVQLLRVGAVRCECAYACVCVRTCVCARAGGGHGEGCAGLDPRAGFAASQPRWAAEALPAAGLHAVSRRDARSLIGAA